MAHKKGQGSIKNGRDSNAQMRGVKIFGGQPVVPGNIIIRQVGTHVHPGPGVGLGRDFTLFATREGTVKFYKRGIRRKKFVMVEPHQDGQDMLGDWNKLNENPPSAAE